MSCARRFEEAERWAQRAWLNSPTSLALRVDASSALAHLGRIDEARERCC